MASSKDSRLILWFGIKEGVKICCFFFTTNGPFFIKFREPAAEKTSNSEDPVADKFTFLGEFYILITITFFTEFYNLATFTFFAEFYNITTFTCPGDFYILTTFTFFCKIKILTTFTFLVLHRQIFHFLCCIREAVMREKCSFF